MTQDRHLLTDIRLDLRHNELRPVYAVATDRRRAVNRPGRFSDFGTVSGRNNLAQAVIMRLLTPRGELAALGHPDYGSRLHQLIGRENSDTLRNLIKLHILESLRLEPRIAEAEVVSVEPDSLVRERVIVQLRVRPTGGTDTVIIGRFTMEFST